MEKLPAQIKKNGFIYKLVKRTDQAAMYSVNMNDQDGVRGQPKQLVVTGYEVFLIKVQKETTVHINKKYGPSVVPTKEKFPGNEDFGKWAWSFLNKEQAEKHFASVNKTDIKVGQKNRVEGPSKDKGLSKNKIVFGEYTISKYNDTVMVTHNRKPIGPKPTLREACMQLKGMTSSDVEKLKIKQMVYILFSQR